MVSHEFATLRYLLSRIPLLSTAFYSHFPRVKLHCVIAFSSRSPSVCFQSLLPLFLSQILLHITSTQMFGSSPLLLSFLFHPSPSSLPFVPFPLSPAPFLLLHPLSSFPFIPPVHSLPAFPLLLCFSSILFSPFPSFLPFILFLHFPTPLLFLLTVSSFPFMPSVHSFSAFTCSFPSPPSSFILSLHASRSFLSRFLSLLFFSSIFHSSRLFFSCFPSLFSFSILFHLIPSFFPFIPFPLSPTSFYLLHFLFSFPSIPPVHSFPAFPRSFPSPPFPSFLPFIPFPLSPTPFHLLHSRPAAWRPAARTVELRLSTNPDKELPLATSRAIWKWSW